jgi:hypothetical protein
LKWKGGRLEVLLKKKTMKMMKKVMDLSEEGEEIEESGDALSDSNVQLGSGFGASCSGSDGNAKS